MINASIHSTFLSIPWYENWGTIISKIFLWWLEVCQWCWFWYLDIENFIGAIHNGDLLVIGHILELLHCNSFSVCFLMYIFLNGLILRRWFHQELEIDSALILIGWQPEGFLIPDDRLYINSIFLHFRDVRSIAVVDRDVQCGAINVYALHGTVHDRAQRNLLIAP